MAIYQEIQDLNNCLKLTEEMWTAMSAEAVSMGYDNNATFITDESIGVYHFASGGRGHIEFTSEELKNWYLLKWS